MAINIMTVSVGVVFVKSMFVISENNAVQTLNYPSHDLKTVKVFRAPQSSIPGIRSSGCQRRRYSGRI